MPLYDVEHVTPLTPDQQATLAQAITDLHARRFKTPKTFINVRYTDVSDQVVFRGGKRVSYNRVVVRTRQGERRTKEIYDDHARDIIKAWEGVVVGPGPSPGDPSASLRTVWIMGALTTAVECGIARPKVRQVFLTVRHGLYMHQVVLKSDPKKILGRRRRQVGGRKHG